MVEDRRRDHLQHLGLMVEDLRLGRHQHLEAMGMQLEILKDSQHNRIEGSLLLHYLCPPLINTR